MNEIYHMPEKFRGDAAQSAVIQTDEGRSLVLAPPGCGKTELLAERILRALAGGTDPADMLCLTFTNRASRSMAERVKSRLGEAYEGRKGKDLAEALFVGNVHRFCSRFLYDNAIVPQGYAIADDNDIISILQNIRGESENIDNLGYEMKEILLRIPKLQHLMHQIASACPKELLLGADCLSKHDLELLCRFTGRPYSRDGLLDIYENIEDILAEHGSGFNESVAGTANLFLHARRYGAYKRDNGILDFDDLLLFTFDWLKANPGGCKRYKWMQVDEVQDLNRLQLAILDLLCEDDACVVYLGDEQQAIFSFIGAELDTLEWLKARCGGRLLHLSNNYRSPKYLLDLFNGYAVNVLEVNRELLPAAVRDEQLPPGALSVLTAELRLKDTASAQDEFDLAVKKALSYPDTGRTAILVPSNADADEISARLDALNAGHFKISGNDLFSTPTVQFLLAHLNVEANENNFIAWSRLLKQFGLVRTYSAARASLRKLQANVLCPTDFLLYPDSSFVLEFCRAVEGEYVIFDTETTGLDVFEDDIIQLAAVKVRGGEVVDSFNEILHTERPIPAMLGDKPNPLVELYASSVKSDRKEGLTRFLRWAGDVPLLGHNVEFDRHILDFNLRRDCLIFDFNDRPGGFFDTLKFARLVKPGLPRYRLEDLVERFSLSGENSHRADEDVAATKSLVDYLVGKMSPGLESHRQFLFTTSAFAERFREKYQADWLATRRRMYDRGGSCISDELHSFYITNVLAEHIEPCRKLNYLLEFISNEVTRPSELSLYEQLAAHLADLNTFKESDLCDNATMKERLFVSTVHKAKGLEFENVVVFDVVDGTYPFFKSKSWKEKMEDARKLYVALSRARKRLCLTLCRRVKGISVTGRPYDLPKSPSPFLESIRRHFV